MPNVIAGRHNGHDQQMYANPTPSPDGHPQTESVVNAGAVVGGVIGGLAIVLLAVFTVLILRTRTRRKYAKAASSQFLISPSPIPPTPPTPHVRRPSIHKERPPPARYMPPLSVTGSMRSFDPPSTIQLPAGGTSPIRDYLGTAMIQSSNAPRRLVYEPQQPRLTAENLREYTRFASLHENSMPSNIMTKPAVAKVSAADNGAPVLL